MEDKKEDIKEHLRTRIEVLDEMIKKRGTDIQTTLYDIDRAKVKVEFLRQQMVNLQTERHLLLVYKSGDVE